MNGLVVFAGARLHMLYMEWRVRAVTAAYKHVGIVGLVVDFALVVEKRSRWNAISIAVLAATTSACALFLTLAGHH